MTPKSPIEFCLAIPREIRANIEYRKKLWKELTDDTGFRKDFLEMCWVCPEIAFDSLFFTFNPRLYIGKRRQPFILRPQQRVVLNELHDSIIKGYDRAVNKSRDEGATELTTKLFALHWLLSPESMFLLGSRKEEYVDKGTDIITGRVTGDHKTLFHKTLYAIAYLPPCLIPSFRKTYMHFENQENGSVIDGESTNENFAAGDRRTAIFLDEFGRVDYNIAQNIRDSVNDVADCVIYGSTHFYGAGHPFNKVLRSKSVKVSLLPWYKNPEKAQGLYTSPDLNVVEIIDIDYYRKLCPLVFNDIEAHKPFKYGDFERKIQTMPESVQRIMSHIRFKADGCEEIPGNLRSPWHDYREERDTKRSLSQNVWMCPTGAADAYFDSIITDRIRTHFMCQPGIIGEVKFEYTAEGRIRTVQLVRDSGKNRLKWWGNMINGRPDQSHNYILGCDIALGTGASNSVCAIYDVNTCELVGIWRCPDTTPENFADQVVALALWAGGKTKSYIIWENNGGHAINFGRRVVIFHQYFPIYINHNEVTKIRKKGNKYGWHSGREQKDDLLTGLKIALSESLRTEKTHNWITIYDETLLDELDDYIWYESGEIGASEKADESSGARTRHGDTVIAAALCLLATKEQRKASHQQIITAPYGSFGYRLNKYREEQKKIKAESPWLV